MNKPREFWILDNGSDPYYTAYSKPKLTSFQTIHVREVTAQDDMIKALRRCIAALEANGAPNCEAVKEAKMAIAKAGG